MSDFDQFLLLEADGATRTAAVNPSPLATSCATLPQSRTMYAAAHVVPRVTGENVPGSPADIDWDATLDIRRRIYGMGLGVADAMDTAQRNQGIDFAATEELIQRSAEVARECDGALVVGVNTDHLDERSVSLSQVVDAYKMQLDVAEQAGAMPVLMASRHLAAAAQSAEDYRSVYREVLQAATGPVVLHWLGAAFDPALTGYFGSADWRIAAATVLDIIRDDVDRISGIKMSLLDWESEVYVRHRLPDGVRMFTGDDFNYARLIGGVDVYDRDFALGSHEDDRGHSDALLGAFAAFPQAAAAAVQELDNSNPEGFRRILEPTEALSRQIFAAPTYYYKTGVAFMSWLNGLQPAFQMVGGMHAARSLPHLSRIVELANEAGVLVDPDLAAERWHAMLALSGVRA
jgi:hypothetical protein